MSVNDLIRRVREVIAELVRRIKEIAHRLRFRVVSKAEEYIEKHTRFLEDDVLTRLEVEAIRARGLSYETEVLLIANFVYAHRLRAVAESAQTVLVVLKTLGKEVKSEHVTLLQDRLIREAKNILDSIIMSMEIDTNTATHR